jgi:hypothetical protein
VGNEMRRNRLRGRSVQGEKQGIKNKIRLAGSECDPVGIIYDNGCEHSSPSTEENFLIGRINL